MMRDATNAFAHGYAGSAQASAYGDVPATQESKWRIGIVIVFGLIGGATACIFFYQMALNFLYQKVRHILNIECVLDSSGIAKNAKVATVNFPFYEILPGAAYLRDFGVIPKIYSSSFTIKTKDGNKLKESCEYLTYDYSVRQKEVTGRVFRACYALIINLPTLLSMRRARAITCKPARVVA